MTHQVPREYKPVILLGNGARNNPKIIEYLCGLNIPILTTWMGCDLVPEDSLVFCGRPGILGQRAANITQQKATHLHCIGARLDGEQVAYDYDRFAPDAEIFVYDVDAAELDKYPDRYTTVKVDIQYIKKIHIERGPDAWLKECKDLYSKFRYELDGGDELDPFSFMRVLGEASDEYDVFALGSSGGAPCAFYQAFKIKQGQRVSNVSTIGAMGADIPMALGAAMATERRVICPTGDGGFQQNVQELETVRRLVLPINFFVMNNNGYNSIRNMQNVRFDGHQVGCDPDSGFTMPNLEELADAYRISYYPMHKLDDLEPLCNSFPVICEVFISPEWQQFPRVMASTVDGKLRTDDMQDMTPKL